MKSNKWQTMTLGDFCTITMGQSPKSVFYNHNGEGLPFLQGNRTFGDKYPTFDTWTTSVTREAEAGDVIMSVRAPVGDVNITPSKICLGRGVCSLRHKDGRAQEFLYYLMKANKDALVNRENGTVFGSVNRSDIHNLEVTVPPIDEQIGIGYLLSTLDGLILNNQKINHHLAELSSSLYRKLISTTDTLAAIGDIGNVVGGGTPSKKVPDYWNGTLPWLTPKDLSINSSTFTSVGQNSITVLGYQHSSAKMIPKNSVLFSSRAPIGYITISENEISTNQGFKSIVPADGIPYTFVYEMLRAETPRIESSASGSTFKEVSGSQLKRHTIKLPSLSALESFNATVEPLFMSIKSNEAENKNLALLRNTLLPQLMDGKSEWR